MKHPVSTPYLYYQTTASKPFVDRAEGVYIWDHTGKRYLDGCSGAMICNIGHGDPRVLAAINEQAQKTFFSYRTQFENEPAHRLAEKLVFNSSEHLTQVFYVSGGSEAVESAVKLCRQYFYARGEGRYLCVTRQPSYHGATLGALSFTSYAPLEAPFRPLMQRHPRIPAPYCYRCPYGSSYPECGLRCAWALEDCILDNGANNVMAFLAEPLTGASGGAIPPPPGYFDVIQDICRKYGILLILDEVMTGFGRTGALFAYEHWDVEADIVALSKGMASGYFPLGATLSRKDIVDPVLAHGGFAHGHTYAGSPMACAVGQAVLDVILEDSLPQNAQAMGLLLGAGLQDLAERHPSVGQVRGMGLLWAVELVRDKESREPFAPERHAAVLLTNEAYDEGLIVYPRRCINGVRGDHVLVAPPLIVNEGQIREILDLLDRALTRVEAKLEPDF